MARTTTVLTGFEKRTGGQPGREWTAHRFTDNEGKRFEIFNDEEQAKLGKLLVAEEADVVIDFTVKTTPKADGTGTWVNNDVNGLYRLGDEPEEETPAKVRGGGGRKFDPALLTLQTYVEAFGVAISLAASGLAGEIENFDDLDKIAQAIIAKGKATVAGAAPATTEPAEAATEAEAVPN